MSQAPDSAHRPRNWSERGSTTGSDWRQELLDDEISLWDILVTLQKSWQLIAALSVGTGMVALVACLVWPQQYEARGLIQVARIGNLQAAPSSATSLSAPVETNAVVIQRLKSEAFANRLIQSLKSPISLDANEPKGSGLVEIVVRAPSATLAAGAVNTSIEMIAQEHARVVESNSKSLARSVESTKQELSRTSELLKTVIRQSSQLARQDSDLALLIGQMQSALISQQTTLNDRLLRLEFALSPVNTNPTALLEEVASSDQPVTPKIGLVTTLALLAGGFMGILIAFLRQAWRNRPQSTVSDQ